MKFNLLILGFFVFILICYFGALSHISQTGKLIIDCQNINYNCLNRKIDLLDEKPIVLPYEFIDEFTRCNKLTGDVECYYKFAKESSYTSGGLHLQGSWVKMQFTLKEGK